MSYRGTRAPIPIGVDGMYGITRVPITGLINFRNGTLENNILEKEGGATPQNSAALAGSILAMRDWWPDPLTQRLIAVISDGSVKRDEGAWTFPTTPLAPGILTATRHPPHIVEGGAELVGRAKKMFIFDGNTSPQVGSGDFVAMTSIANPPTGGDWVGARQPFHGIVHQGRLWAFLDHVAYVSSPTDHEDFRAASGGVLIPIEPGFSQYISAAWSFAKMLIVFKYPKGIFIIDTSQINPVNWRYDPQSWAVGCSGPYGPVAIPNDVLFPDAIGHFHVLSRTGVERDAESSNIFSPKMEEWQRAQISPSRMPFAHLIYYDDKRMAYAAVSGLGSIKNDRRVTIDFNNPRVGPRFMYSDRDVVQSLVMRKIGGIDRPYSGDDVGKVWRMDESTRSKDGAGYIGVFQTDHSDLAEIVPEWKARTKSFDFLEFEFESVGNYNLSVNIYIDGVLKTVTPLAFSMSGVGVPLGSFVLDVDRLGVTARSRRKRRLGFHGTRISIEGFNSGPGETFRITEALVYGRVAE